MLPKTSKPAGGFEQRMAKGPDGFFPSSHQSCSPRHVPSPAQPEMCHVLVQEEEVSKQLAVGLAAGEVRALLQKWPEASRQVIL